MFSHDCNVLNMLDIVNDVAIAHRGVVVFPFNPYPAKLIYLIIFTHLKLCLIHICLIHHTYLQILMFRQTFHSQ